MNLPHSFASMVRAARIDCLLISQFHIQCDPYLMITRTDCLLTINHEFRDVDPFGNVP